MTTTVKTCNCGEENAPSTTEVTIPCTSQIEEMSSSMASILATAAPGAPAPGPAQATAAQATGEGGSGEPGGGSAPAEGNSAPADNEEGKAASGNTPNEAGNVAEGATEARTADVPEMTNDLAPETGLPAENNVPVYYATTQTIHLQSTETSNATNGSMSVKAPHLVSESRAEASQPKRVKELLLWKGLWVLWLGHCFALWLS
jgi:hypothetical protein